MQLSRMVVAQWVGPAQSMAASIAELSLRECELLDQVWAARNPDSCFPSVKRRHKQFLSELLAYYCCVCEQYLDAYGGDTEHVMDAIVDEAVELALKDPFILRAPYFRGDLFEIRRGRYQRHIMAKRAKHGDILPWLSRSFLTARTALELRLIMTWNSTDSADLMALEGQLAQRLEWTANELIGQ